MTIDTFHLPAGFSEFHRAAVPGPGSRSEHCCAVLTDEGADSLLASLRAAKTELSRRSASQIAEALGAVGERFLDPTDPLRLEAFERTAAETAFSLPVVERIIDGMARDWTADRLLRLLDAEFPDPCDLDGFRSSREGTRVRAIGGTLGFHIGAGTVPGVGTTSLIRSLLVKCPVVLKPGRGDTALPVLFAKGLAASDPQLSKALAVIYWKGGEGGPLERRLLSSAERIVVYGGTEVVATLRSTVPATTPIVAYHHRISVGAVARECLSSPEAARNVAHDAARAIAAFDQRGCVSPRIVWVEEGGNVTAADWARALASALRFIEAELPAARLSDVAASALRQIQESVALERAGGAEAEVYADEEAGWAVYCDPEASPTWIGEGRIVVVKPVPSLTVLHDLLTPLGPLLQTLALEAPADRRPGLSILASDAGATRITRFADQPWPPAWWRHDGRGPLDCLVRWAEIEP